MKIITILLTLMCLTLISNAQSDTIFTKKGETIICKITKVTQLNIWYTEKNTGKSISLNDVNRHTANSTVIQKAKLDIQLSFLADTIGTYKVSAQSELIHLKKCLYKFHRQHRTGLILSMSGAAITLLPNLISDEPMKGLTMAGLAIAFTGLIIDLDSYKWIKRAAIGVNGKGLNVTYTF